MKSIPLELNLFKIRALSFEKVFKFSVFPDIKDPKKDNIYSLAARRNAIVYNKELYEVVSYIKPDIKYEEISIYDLEDVIQERLLSLYYRDIIEKVNCRFQAIQKGKFIIKRGLRHSVIRIREHYYLNLDLYHEIYSKEDVWSYFDYNIGLLKTGLKVRDIENTGSVGEISKIITPEDKEYQSTLNSILEYYEKQNKNIVIKYNNQPIIFVKFSGNPTLYPYLAQRLKLVLTTSDVDLKAENLLRISNENRKRILIRVIQQSELMKVCEDKPLNEIGAHFDAINIKTKSGLKESPKKIIEYVKYKKDDTSKEIPLVKITPYRIPHSLKDKKILVFMFMDEELKGKKDIEEKAPINILFRSLRESVKGVGSPEFVNANKIYEGKINYYYDFNNYSKIIHDIKSLNIPKDTPNLVITIAKKDYMKSDEDYYEPLKRSLFNMNILHQNIVYEHIISSYKTKTQDPNRNFEIENLVLQILVKFGMYPYSLNIDLGFDYILGVDIGNDRYGTRRIGGGISIFNKNGVLDSIIPLTITTGGENVDMKYLLEKLANHIDLQNKKMLILKDGNLNYPEVASAAQIAKNLNITHITILNIIKRQGIRILEDKEGSRGIVLKDNLALLLNHKFDGAQTIKITSKYRIEDGTSVRDKITYKDLNILYALSNLNYSNIYIKSERLKYPAPIHYSDKFVKAIGKEWHIDNQLLLEGYLYFL